MTGDMKNEKQLELSIIIITKNEELNISNCINSIIRNHFPYSLSEFEIIVIDSNSTDRTREIVMDYKKSILNLELYNITSSSQYSASLSRSKGISLSKGRYILFLDGDMELQYDFLNKSKLFFDNNSIEIMGLIGIRNDYFRRNGIVNTVKRNVYNSFEARECKHFGGAAIFIATKLKEVSGYDNKILASEEPELYLRIKEKKYKVYELPIEMINHYIDENTKGNRILFSILNVRSMGLGQCFYKTIKEKRWTYLFIHKPLSLFFIPFIISCFSIFLLIVYIFMQHSYLLNFIVSINIGCLIYMIKNKSVKKYIYTIINFLLIVRGFFSYKKVECEIEKST